ncbi:MAG: CPBP family intramembrane glutamic endopeptidase [Chitinophagales bacterium]
MRKSKAISTIQPLPIRQLLLLGLITLLGMGGLGLILLPYTSEITWQILFEKSSIHLYSSLALGGGIGLGASIVSLFISRSFPTSDLERKLRQRLPLHAMNSLTIVFLSLCAGIGEELLFRGPLLFGLFEYISLPVGILLNAIFFVGLHGYLNPKQDLPWVLRLWLIAFASALGLMTISLSLVSAITAHTIYDLILLHAMRRDSLSA